MSKGKRKSNPEALKLVRQRLNGQQTHFTEEDRGLLLQLCRLDLIQILEEDLCMGPLKASQKNSVACMVDFLLSQQHGPPLSRADSRQRSGRRSSNSDTLGQPGPSKFSPEAPCFTAAVVRCPSSGGGSCHTPSTAPDDQQPRLHTPPSTNARTQQHAAAHIDCQPWLAELHHELAAAGNLWGLRGDDTTDTDDDTTGTEADSSWVPSAADLTADMGLPHNSWQLEPPASAGGVAGTASRLQVQSVLDTSQVEELLVQQLLLDIESAPRAHRSSSFRNTPQQQLQPEAERQPPPLLQQKLQQLDQQQQMLKQQQQQMQLQQVLRQQQLEQEMQWLEQQTAAEFDRRLQDELIQQLEAAASAQQQQQQSGADPLQLTTTSSMGPTPGAAAAATTAGGLMEQQQVPGLSIGVQPSQLTSWPLPNASRQASLPAAATAVAAAGATHVGLLLHGLSDAALPLSQGPRRLSLDAGGLVRKRDKMLMGLLAVKDEGPTGATELSVELSGPSAELPTKRMSLTLPGVAEGASLPTSFSGRVAGMGGQPHPGDLQQLMQLNSCEDPTDVWQQSALIAPAGQQAGLAGLAGVQYNQRDQGIMQPGVQGDGAAGSGGFAGRLKTLLRGKKAKARRYNSVGAGASFTSFTGSACALPTGRIPSDPVTTRDAAAATADSNRGWVGQPATSQQLLGGQRWGDHGSASFAAEGPMRAPSAPAGARLWHSATVPPVYREHSDPTLGRTAGVGGFSWHAEEGTTLAAASGPLPAGRSQQQESGQWFSGSYPAAAQPPVGVAGSDSQFAQQLAQLRAVYSTAEQYSSDLGGGGDPYWMQTTAAAEGNSSSMEVGEKPGLVKKLVQAFKLNGQPAQSPALQVNPGQDLGGQDEELLVMGRCNGQLDLGAALQWQAGPGGPGLLEELLLQGFGADMQDDS